MKPSHAPAGVVALEALADFNAKRRQEHDIEEAGLGIACPQCGAELRDIDPLVTLTSNPPQKTVGCQCGYRGYRVA